MKFAGYHITFTVGTFYTYAVPSEMENRIATGMRGCSFWQSPILYGHCEIVAQYSAASGNGKIY